jgi:hypothetical protein
MENTQLLLIILLLATVVVGAYFYIRRRRERDGAFVSDGDRGSRDREAIGRSDMAGASPSGARTTVTSDTAATRSDVARDR